MVQFRFVSTLIVVVVLAALVGAAVPALAAGNAQSAPIENSIFPALLQVALIMLIAQGLKSLLAALGGTNDDGTPKYDLRGREAAIAYIGVGIIVYAVEKFVMPALSAANAAAVTDFLQVLALLLAGSGLFSMTSAFRVQSNGVRSQK
ncbi:MAG: hypothetical protein MOGMAGMI_02506 [Candidatus Omnitrophica bacterium]|nr:hypothetical protein [Candidatus Omnitrophota bacterium]